LEAIRKGRTKAENVIDQPNTSMRRNRVIRNNQLTTRENEETFSSATKQLDELRDSMQECRNFITSQQKELSDLRRTAAERQSIPES
jgi:hypothetical protein